MNPFADVETCPCGTGIAYGRCCRVLHAVGSAGIGTTAEATMRARYSAYVVGDAAFLLATWHPTTRPAAIDFSEDVDWHGLTIEHTDGGDGLSTTGSVQFRARFRRGDALLELHESSRFVRESGRWFYVDGVDPDSDAA